MIDGLWIPGKPTPKGRPRMTRRGRVYTPQTTLDAELVIAQAVAEYGAPPVDEPCELHVEFYGDGVYIELVPYDVPSAGPLRGDLDNYVKLVMDALQKDADGVAGQGGAVLPNDRMVVRLVADKAPVAAPVAVG